MDASGEKESNVLIQEVAITRYQKAKNMSTSDQLNLLKDGILRDIEMLDAIRMSVSDFDMPKITLTLLDNLKLRMMKRYAEITKEE